MSIPPSTGPPTPPPLPSAEVPASAIAVTSAPTKHPASQSQRTWLQVLIYSHFITAVVIAGMALVFWRVSSAFGGRANQTAASAAAAVTSGVVVADEPRQAANQAVHGMMLGGLAGMGYLMAWIFKTWALFQLGLAVAVAATGWQLKVTGRPFAVLIYSWVAIVGFVGLWRLVFFRAFGAYMLAPAAMADPTTITITQFSVACGISFVMAAWLIAHAVISGVAMTRMDSQHRSILES